MVARLDKVLTVPQVAAIAGWSRQRMLRHLLHLNEQVGGMLLRNISRKGPPKYTITLQALQQCAPEWFRDPESIELQLEQMRAEIHRLNRIVAMHTDKLLATG